MKFAYSNEQMREMDNHTIENGTPSGELMERAGAALCERVKAVMAERGIDDVLFVCGGGNNGGDGFVAARLLQEEGVDVQIMCFAQKFSPDCLVQTKKYKGDILGVMPRRRYALIVDCIFGTGLSHASEGDNAALIEFINNSGAYVIACDMPSGLSGAGVAFFPCVKADETTVMGQLKEGLLLADGADCAGKITLCDIGIYPDDERGVEIWEAADIKAFFPKKKSHTNKGTYGAAAIIAGDKYSGAAFLSTGACLKSGAGYTRLYVSQEIYPCAVGKLPAAVLQKFERVDEELLKCDCVALGMGMGVSEELYALVKELVNVYAGTLLLDADALNVVAKYGVEVLKNKKCRIVLTPHIKEFSRLCQKSVEEILAGGTAVVRAFAKEYNVTLVLKNNRTVIADRERCAVITAGSPVLAKGGSGDVLAGFMAGTIARGISVFDAACCASFIMGRAGEISALEMGEYAPDAQDIISHLPRAMKEI